MKTLATTRKTLKARDIPASWQVELPDDPEASVTIWISPVMAAPGRRLVDFIGSGKGVYASRAEADDHITKLREEWQS